jgi:peptidoglycan hydrolase-like protein with peptidoglycan-binding domain
VVTRKLIHGRWVRTTQVVHSQPSGPSYQTHPDTERYQQIQQALAQKGYFKGEANGTWGDDSVSALKQYQTESKIPNDGKISALSLIGLGLGPNRETPAEKSDPALPLANADQPNR